MISSFSSSRLPDVGVTPRTNDQIRDLIAEKIARFRSSFLSQKQSTGSLLQAEGNTPSTGDELPQTSTSFTDQQHLNPAAVGLLNDPKVKPPLEEDDSGVSRADSSSKGKVYPQVLSEVAATFAKNREESPVVPTSSSVKTIDKLMENYQSSENGREDSNPSNSLGLAPINQTEQVCNEVKPNNVAEILHSPTLKQPQCGGLSDEDASQQSDKLQSINKSSSSTRNTELVLEHVKTQINSELGQEPVSPETESSCSCFAETGDCSCPKCDREGDLRGQTSSVEDELESQLDDDDDDWEVIPLSIVALTFEQAGNPENASQDCDSGEELRPRSKPVPASAFLRLEVFDTPGEQKQAGKFGQLSFVESSSHSSHKQEPQTLKRRRDSSSEHEDSCDTDYSSDYSSGPEHNHLTASKRLFRSLSAPMSTKTSEFEIRNLKKARENGVEESIIIHDSDSESEDDSVATEREKNVESRSEVEETTSSVHRTSSTPTEVQVQNEAKKKSSKEKNVIIILSDSDDDSTGVSIRAKDVSESEDSDKTDVREDLEPSAGVPKPKPDDKPETSRQTIPGNKDGEKDHSTKKLETKDGEDDLNDSDSGLSAKRKKVKKPAVFSPRSDQRHERFSERASSSSTRPKKVQTSAPRQRSRSYESSTSYPPFPFRKSSSLTATRSVQGTSHARSKVHSDWERKHIPLRRERRVPSRYK